MKNELITKAEADKLRKKNEAIIVKAEKMEITSPKQEAKAYENLKVIKDALKFVEDKRTAITKPLNQSLREVNAMFKKLAEPLNNADSILRSKVKAFRDEQAEIARKEEERRNKIRESHKERGHKVHAPAIVESVVSSSTVTQKRWTFDVEDISKVPSKYLVVDSAEVRDAIADGTREISGLKIYQKETLVVR